jgi:hypothetical protein
VGPVDLQTARVTRAGADVLECPRGRRGLPIRIVSPAHDGSIRSDTTRMRRARAHLPKRGSPSPRRSRRSACSGAACVKEKEATGEPDGDPGKLV